MMSISQRLKGYLNEEQCFMLWVELGSLKKVARHLKNMGIVGPAGKRVSDAAISIAATRWVLENPEEVREYYIADGFGKNDLEWEEYLVRRAIRVYSVSSYSRFARWIKRNKFEKYFYIFAVPLAIEDKVQSLEDAQEYVSSVLAESRFQT